MVQGERRTTKIERYGAEGIMDAVLRGGGTLKQACAAFEEATGEPIGLAAVCRYRKKIIRGAVDKMRQTEILVDRLIQREGITYDGCDPGEAMADLARRMLMTRAVDAVAEMPPEEMAKLTPDKLAGMIARLESTRVSGERLRLQYDRAFATAKEAIFKELEEGMREHPDLYQKVCDVAEAAYVNAVEKVEGRQPVSNTSSSAPHEE